MKSIQQWQGKEDAVEKAPQKMFESTLDAFTEFDMAQGQPGQTDRGAAQMGDDQQPDAGNQPALAPAAHKADEDGMDLPGMIEKRLEMLMQELESKSKGALTRPKQMELLQQVLGTLAEKFGMNRTAATQVVQNTFAGGGGQSSPGMGGSASPAAQPQVAQ